MPSLTFRINKLDEIGPTLEVSVLPPSPLIEHLSETEKKNTVLRKNALIDTGASVTCISQSIVEKLNLIPFDIQNVLTASGETPQLIYDMGILLPLKKSQTHNIQSFSIDLSNQSYEILVGRDVLSYYKFIYDGINNSFTLSI